LIPCLTPALPNLMFKSLVLVLLALFPLTLAAQGPLRSDQKIRVLVTERDMQWRTAATVLEVRDDSVVLAVAGSQRTFARLDLSEFELGVGRGNRARWSALGAVSGTAAGFGFSLLDAIGYNRGQGHRDHPLPPDPPYPAGRRIAVTLGGSVVGAVLGLLLPGEHWRPFTVAPPPSAPAAP
jgi:hypothetical protein